MKLAVDLTERSGIAERPSMVRNRANDYVPLDQLAPSSSDTGCQSASLEYVQLGSWRSRLKPDCRHIG